MVLHKQSLKASYDFIKNELENNTIYISRALKPIAQWIKTKPWENAQFEVCSFSVDNCNRLSSLDIEFHEYRRYSVDSFYVCARINRAHKIFTRDYLTLNGIDANEETFMIEGIALKDWCTACDKCIILRRGSY